MTGFLTDLHVTGFQCLRDVKCVLTPLHAFIGPNDSGKSTLLKLIESLLSRSLPNALRVYAKFSDGSDLRLNHAGRPRAEVTIGRNPQIEDAASAGVLHPSALSVRVLNGHEVAQLIRLNADELRMPSPLIPYGMPLSLLSRGRNIAGLYDAVRDRNVERFAAMSKRVTELFPTVKALGLRATRQTEKVLTVTLVDDTEVLSDGMSEGLLYYLAFAILGNAPRPVELRVVATAG